MYLTSNRSGGYGNYDIWVSRRSTTDDEWGTPVNIGPTINTNQLDFTSYMSPDNLELYFGSHQRSGGYGMDDIWVTRRTTIHNPWGQPTNLGPVVNSSANDWGASISPDGQELYFCSNRPGGYGLGDIWVTRRVTKDDPWGEPTNLGPVVNSPASEAFTFLSSNGLLLFFSDDWYAPIRPGGFGNMDMWVTRRASISDPWGAPVNLGPIVNSPSHDCGPRISPDGFTLYFNSERPGGYGGTLGDIYQAPIIPIVDLNGDGVVDAADMCIIVDHWGTDEPLCDIGPTPLGDGIVDVQDLIVLAEHLFEGIPPVELEEVNVDEKDAGSQVELEQGRILVVTLESNPTTGYRWEQAENQESILEQMGEAEFKPSETVEPPLVGAGGWEIFRFKAISVGEMTLQLVYHRAWEEGVEPLNTFSIQVVVN
jgi:predicted secreted protein